MTFASRDWGGFLSRWTLLAVPGFGLSFFMAMLPFGLGFRPFWAEQTSWAGIQRGLALVACNVPYLFVLAMIIAWPIFWFRGVWAALIVPMYLLPIQLMLLICVLVLL